MSTTQKYPYNWGIPIVNAFVEKYARGLHYFCKLVGYAPGEVRHYLVLTVCSGNSIRWEATKLLIKQFNSLDADELKRYTEMERKALYKRLVSMAHDVVLDENNAKITIDSRNLKS